MRNKILNICSSVFLFVGIILYILLLVIPFCYAHYTGNETITFLSVLEDRSINYFYLLVMLILSLGTPIMSVGINKKVASIPLIIVSLITNTFFLIIIISYINNMSESLNMSLEIFYNNMIQPGLILGYVGIGILYVADIILLINKSLGSKKEIEDK